LIYFPFTHRSERSFSKISLLPLSDFLSTPSPTNKAALKAILTFVGYYKKFIKHFILITQPLSELLKKEDRAFEWTKKEETAFLALKQSITILQNSHFGTQTLHQH
jgi:hypothetical protein